MADLARSLLTTAVRDLREARRSGVLVVNRGGLSKGIFFRSGDVVFASSTDDKDKLGEHLVRLGRISRAEFLAALELSKGKKRLGRQLVDAGFLNEEDLGRSVAMQVQKIVLSLFIWTEGETRFHDSAEPIPADLAVDLSTSRLLFEGARLFPDSARLERALPPDNQTLRLVARPPFDITSVPFTPPEKDVMARMAEGAPLAVLLTGKHRRDLLVRAVHALLAAGLVETAGTVPIDLSAATTAEVLEVDTGTFRLAIAEPAPAPAPPATEGEGEDADLRSHVLQLYEALPRSTHYEVLGVPSNASEAQMKAAYETMTRQQEQWGVLARDARLGSLIGTLVMRRRQAFQVLTDPQRRGYYDLSLGRPAPPRPAPVKVEERHNSGRIVREAQELLLQLERERAIALLLEGVRVDPQDHAMRRLLAITLADHPELFRNAERHFAAALETDPGDIELRFRFAKYYRRAGMPRRAMVELKRLQSIDPSHKQAVALLKQLQQDMKG